MGKKLLLGMTALLLLLFASQARAGDITTYNFTGTLPSYISLAGGAKFSPSKTGGGVCSDGAVEVAIGQAVQFDLPSCNLFELNMKSSASGARTMTLKYKKQSDADYITLTSTLSVQAAATFTLSSTYPQLKSTEPVSIRLETTNGGTVQVHDLRYETSNALSNAAAITAFKIPNQIGNETINSTAKTIAINVPMGTALTSVVPTTLTISPLASVSPLPTVAQDFSNGQAVSYVVTAQDNTPQTWTVTVTEVASSAKDITAFKLANNQIGDAVIDATAGTIRINMPLLADITNVTPVTLTTSPAATVNPVAGTAQDFTAPVTYIVKAQDNSTKTWTVIVSKVDPDAVYYTYEAEDAEFTGKVDNQHTGYTGRGFVDFLAGGENYILFTICQPQAGTQTAKFRYALAKDEIRKGELYVNDVWVKTLAFPRTTTFTDWQEEMAVVSLQAGVNNIKITWEETDGPNLDNMTLTGTPCATYTLTTTSTNGGSVTVSPQRTDNKFFEGETVTLLANSKPDLLFENWGGDLSGSQNPAQVVMTANKNISAQFKVVNTYKLNVITKGIGQVELSPAGGEYTEGTVVTLTAKSILGSTFANWTGDLTGGNATTTITMTANKEVTATFTSDIKIDFNKVVGFASIDGDSFVGPTTGGGAAGTKDTLIINGPNDFDKLCQKLYNRIKYKYTTTNPLTIILEAGEYNETNCISSSSVWGNHMLTVQDQGNLTIIGRKNVTLKFGINIKRGSNIIIRNISFMDYYDDGINIGERETHHIWVDHCTVGNPTVMPANTEHPDGGIDIKAGASFITISWTKYQNSWKTGLVGHSDNNGSEDNGRLKVTYYNNHFYHTNSRNPRVRFGVVHVLNCLHEQVQLYGIVAANSSCVYAENNFFLNTRWGMYADRNTADFKAVFGDNKDGVFTSKTGNIAAYSLKQVGNMYDDSGLPVITASINPAMLNPGGRSVKFDEYHPELACNPRDYYDYEAVSPTVTRVIVPMFAGADKVEFFPTSTLPVEVLSFKATFNKANNKVLLNWETDNEVNFKKYAVEKSADGKNYTAIGEVTAMNTPGKHSYSFGDANIQQQGVLYYRLNLVNIDGANKYSNVVPVTINNNTTVAVSIYPNPVNDVLYINHPASNTGGRLKVLSVLGTVVKMQNIQVNATQSVIDVSKISSGNYILLLENGSDITSLKFVKK